MLQYQSPSHANILLLMLLLCFVGMEIETMVRYKLPVIIIIVNNSGIYSGFPKDVMEDIQSGGDIAQWYVMNEHLEPYSTMS